MNQLKGKLYLLCAFSLAGTSVVSARFVTGKLGNFTITAVSLFFALVFLVLLCGRQLIRCLSQMSFRDFGFLILQALCGIFLFRMFLLNGLRNTSAGEAGILTGATPAITAILAIAVLREPAGSRKVFGILCTVIGILVIQGVLTPGSGLDLKHMGGNMLVLCAAACESVFNTLSRISALRNSEESAMPSNPVSQTTIVTAIAMVLCLIPAAFEHPIKRLAAIDLLEWTALLWYGIFVTALAFICWYAGIKRCGAFTAAAFSGMMPFTSMLLSAALLGENADWRQWVGGFLIIIGMFLIGSKGTNITLPINRSIRLKEKHFQP
ncbi:drug/metabolite transporter (DMT)-like permease [Kineothrix alysoides]|uniref:Drug/metabolite transporter (DMT)-like permease n=1 Tax=Kineothrix alysoides TaxID=1469948 RepID=A0A4R1QNE1_9FIRM|nr:DMT family transporter [Kineothrix alysoides]TCL55246.1 drug/metabolite transporter (DMT)-like permease [Kineothrix alysoides]